MSLELMFEETGLVSLIGGTKYRMKQSVVDELFESGIDVNGNYEKMLFKYRFSHTEAIIYKETNLNQKYEEVYCIMNPTDFEDFVVLKGDDGSFMQVTTAFSNVENFTYNLMVKEFDVWKDFFYTNDSKKLSVIEGVYNKYDNIFKDVMDYSNTDIGRREPSLMMSVFLLLQLYDPDSSFYKLVECFSGRLFKKEVHLFGFKKLIRKLTYLEYYITLNSNGDKYKEITKTTNLIYPIIRDSKLFDLNRVDYERYLNSLIWWATTNDYSDLVEFEVYFELEKLFDLEDEEEYLIIDGDNLVDVCNKIKEIKKTYNLENYKNFVKGCNTIIDRGATVDEILFFINSGPQSPKRKRENKIKDDNKIRSTVIKFK